MSTLFNYVARLPDMVGYELDDRHVVAAFVSGRDHAPLAAVTWDRSIASDQVLAHRLARALARLPRPAASRVLLVGYGPEGPDRTALLAEELRHAIPTSEPVQVHVMDTTARIRFPGHQDWSRPESLPDTTAQAVLDGRPIPASSREALADRYRPVDSPLYEVSPTHSSAISDSPPGIRADAAIRTLDKLAEPGPDDPSHMAMLAEMVDTATPAVRDAILISAASDPARTEALVRTYRAAPATHRDSLASVAAAAVYLNGGQAPAVDAILQHADHTGSSARLTALITAAKNSGINPYRVRDALITAAPAALESADTAWHAARAARAASFPSHAQTAAAHPASDPSRAPTRAPSSQPDLDR